MNNSGDDQYKTKLSDEQYRVLRQKATETPGSGTLLHNTQTGEYRCAACNNLVFKSDTKFDSRSGWPSFYSPANKNSVVIKEDKELGISRDEVICSQCGSHLGHVFRDVHDQPSGMRYCINSVALSFSKTDK